MNTYNYEFDYGFLQELKDAKNLTKRDITRILGTQDYCSVNRWLSGKCPVPVEYMMRLCNHFQMNMNVWFKDVPPIESIKEKEEVANKPTREVIIEDEKDLEILRIKLECERRINEKEKDCQDRIDNIVREYNNRLDMKRDKIYEIVKAQQAQIERLQEMLYGHRQQGQSYAMVSEDVKPKAYK